MFRTRHNQTHATAAYTGCCVAVDVECCFRCVRLVVCVNLGPKSAISCGEQNRYGWRRRTLLTTRLIKFYSGLRLMKSTAAYGGLRRRLGALTITVSHVCCYSVNHSNGDKCTLNYCINGSIWHFKFPKVVQAHTLVKWTFYAQFLLRVSSGTILTIFIEIGSYLTEKEQKVSWHSFFETWCTYRHIYSTYIITYCTARSSIFISCRSTYSRTL